MIRVRWLWLLVSITVFLPVLRPAAAQTACFPGDKTPWCLDPIFATYWRENGGLSVFGYPQTAPYEAHNNHTSSYHLTQWVERNRLEWHPENAGTPYTIQLGLLGKELRGWDPAVREPGPQPDCLWFAETGLNVCDQQAGTGFKSYWQSHGLTLPGVDAYGRSLQLFGLPISSPKMEINSSGDAVLTQWFERARFEWHPQNPRAFRVLLGLLGSEERAQIKPRFEPGNCAASAPPIPAQGAQVWVLKATPSAGGTADPQTICARLVRGGKLQTYTEVLIKIWSPETTSMAPDGILQHSGIISGDGIAYVSGYHAGYPEDGATITATAVFPTGEQATTTYRVRR